MLYNCHEHGHLAADCPKPQRANRDLKGKSKGKSKGKAANSLEEVDEGISLGCLLKAPTALCPVRVAAPVETWNEYECIEALMDSGAGECVCGPGHFQAISVRAEAGRPGEGVEHICADGGRIPNIGEELVPGLTDDGDKSKVNFQVCDVDRPLIAVSKLTAAGDDVWLGENHGFITHARSGKHTTFFKKNGVYVLRIWVPRSSEPSTVTGIHAAAQLPGGIRQ